MVAGEEGNYLKADGYIGLLKLYYKEDDVFCVKLNYPIF